MTQPTSLSNLIRHSPLCECNHLPETSRMRHRRSSRPPRRIQKASHVNLNIHAEGHLGFRPLREESINHIVSLSRKGKVTSADLKWETRLRDINAAITTPYQIVEDDLAICGLSSETEQASKTPKTTRDSLIDLYLVEVLREQILQQTEAEFVEFLAFLIREKNNQDFLSFQNSSDIDHDSLDESSSIQEGAIHECVTVHVKVRHASLQLKQRHRLVIVGNHKDLGDGDPLSAPKLTTSVDGSSSSIDLQLPMNEKIAFSLAVVSRDRVLRMEECRERRFHRKRGASVSLDMQWGDAGTHAKIQQSTLRVQVRRRLWAGYSVRLLVLESPLSREVKESVDMTPGVDDMWSYQGKIPLGESMAMRCEVVSPSGSVLESECDPHVLYAAPGRGRHLEAYLDWAGGTWLEPFDSRRGGGRPSRRMLGRKQTKHGKRKAQAIAVRQRGQVESMLLRGLAASLNQALLGLPTPSVVRADQQASGEGVWWGRSSVVTVNNEDETQPLSIGGVGDIPSASCPSAIPHTTHADSTCERPSSTSSPSNPPEFFNVDFWIELESCVLVVEVDENDHRTYDLGKERARMMAVAGSLEAKHSKPVLFYRVGVTMPRGHECGELDIMPTLADPVERRIQEIHASVKVDHEQPPAAGFFRVRYIGYKSASRYIWGEKMCDVGHRHARRS